MNIEGLGYINAFYKLGVARLDIFESQQDRDILCNFGIRQL